MAPPSHFLQVVVLIQEDIENKSVILIINSSKLTAHTLAVAFMKLLHYSRNKLREHHEEKQDVKPQGKQHVFDLQNESRSSRESPEQPWSRVSPNQYGT